jgi:hypothetical protein
MREEETAERLDGAAGAKLASKKGRQDDDVRIETIVTGCRGRRRCIHAGPACRSGRRNHALCRGERASAARCDADHGGRDARCGHAHLRGALHARLAFRVQADAGRGREGRGWWQDDRHHAAPGRAFPQRQGDDVGGRGRLDEPLGQVWRSRQAAVRRRRDGRGFRQVRDHAQAAGTQWRVEESARSSRRRRSDLSVGNRQRGDRKARRAGGLHRDRPLQVQRVAPQPLHRGRAMATPASAKRYSTRYSSSRFPMSGRV